VTIFKITVQRSPEINVNSASEQLYCCQSKCRVYVATHKNEV